MSQNKSEPMLIPLAELVENDYNPRKRFDDAAMKELEDSIRRVGLIQPLAVRKKGKKYEVIAGIRRLKALRNIDSAANIPCNVVNVSDQEAKILSISENVARKNLTPIEEARAFAQYFGKIDQKTTSDDLNASLRRGKNIVWAITEEEMDKLKSEIGLSSVRIYKRMSLLLLCEIVQNMIENEELLQTSAEIIAKFNLKPEEQSKYAQMGLSPTEMDKEIQKYIDQLNASKGKLEESLKASEDALAKQEDALAREVKKIVKGLGIEDDIPEETADAAKWLDKTLVDRRAEFVGDADFKQWAGQRASA